MRHINFRSTVRIYSEESNVAEPIKHKKVSLREILDEIAEDESFSQVEHDKALAKIREREYQEWCKKMGR